MMAKPPSTTIRRPASDNSTSPGPEPVKARLPAAAVAGCEPDDGDDGPGAAPPPGEVGVDAPPGGAVAPDGAELPGGAEEPDAVADGAVVVVLEAEVTVTTKKPLTLLPVTSPGAVSPTKV
jgi:hypothetical protein